MDEFGLFKLAQKYRRPLALSALVLSILFASLRTILNLGVFSGLNEEYTFQILNTLIIGLLILALVGLLVGVTYQAYVERLRSQEMGRALNKNAVITGNVSFPDGTPVRGAAVDIFGVEGEKLTNRNGYFEIEVPQKESWIVRAFYDGKATTETVRSLDIDVPLSLTLKTGDENVKHGSSQALADARRVSPSPPPENISVPPPSAGRASATFEPFTEFVSTNLSVDVGLDLLNARKVTPLGITDHSFLEECLIEDQRYVIKRTDRRYCDPQTLRHLKGKKLVASEGSVTAKVATPEAVWETPGRGGAEGYVWELHPFYQGITLYQLITANTRYNRLNGKILGQAFNSIFRAVYRLHELGVLHRDISPSNVLLGGSGHDLTLTVIDCSFACLEGQERVPVANDNYAAPEQKFGQETFKSDLFSIAALIYFLGNAEAPNLSDEDGMRQGLRNLFSENYWPSTSFRIDDSSILIDEDMGHYWPNDLKREYTIGLVIEALLRPDPNKRPSERHEILLESNSYASAASYMYTVLDAKELGFLTLYEYGFELRDRQATAELVSSMQVESKELRAHVEALLASDISGR